MQLLRWGNGWAGGNGTTKTVKMNATEVAQTKISSHAARNRHYTSWPWCNTKHTICMQLLRWGNGTTKTVKNMNATEVAQTKRCSQAARNRHCKTDGEKAEMGDATKNKTETVQQTWQDPFVSSFVCCSLASLFLLVPTICKRVHTRTHTLNDWCNFGAMDGAVLA